jgi:hypothetical protein
MTLTKLKEYTMPNIRMIHVEQKNDDNIYYDKLTYQNKCNKCGCDMIYSNNILHCGNNCGNEIIY